MGNCSGAADRTILLKSTAAGEARVCEAHFKEYRRKYGHLMRREELIKPDSRFSEARRRDDPGQTAEQLRL